MDESMCSEETMSVDRNGFCSMQEDETDASHSTIDLVSTSESDNDDVLEGTISKHEEEDDDDEYVDMSESETEYLQNTQESFIVVDSSLSVKSEDESNIADVPLDTNQQSVRSAQFENSLSSANNSKYFKYNSSSSSVPLAEGKPAAENKSEFSGNCSCASAHCIHSGKKVQENRKNKVTFKLPPKNMHQNKENRPKTANEMGSQGIDNLMIVNEEDKNIAEINVKRSKVYDPLEFISNRRILTATRRTGTSKSNSSKKKKHTTSPCCSTGYEQNHINYLRERERFIPPFHRQSPQLSERPRLVEFIKGVCSARNLSFTTTHLAVTLLDRFMDAHNIKLDQLNLASMSCLLLAAKYEECDENIPRIYRLNEFCETDQYSVTFFYTMEVFMLTFFKWHLGFITPAVFAELFLLRAIQSSDCLELPDNFSDTFDANDDMVRSKPLNPPVLDRLGGVKDLVLDQMPIPVKRPPTPDPLLQPMPMMVDEDSHNNNNIHSGDLGEVSNSLSSQPPRVVKDTYDTSTSSGGSSSSYETISSYTSLSPGGHTRAMMSSRSVANCTDTVNNNIEHSLSVAETVSVHCPVAAIEKTLNCNFTVSDIQAPVASSSKLVDHPNCINDETLSSNSNFVDASSRGQVSVTMSSPHSGEEGEKLHTLSTSTTSSDRTTSTPSRSLGEAPSLPVSPVTSSGSTERVLSPNINLRALTHELWDEVKQLLNKSMDHMSLIDAVPSEVAAACLLTARRGLGFRPVWPSTMRNLTRYSEQQLQRTCNIITGSGDGALAMFPNTPDSGYRSNAATPAASPGEPSPATPVVADAKSASVKKEQ